MLQGRNKKSLLTAGMLAFVLVFIVIRFINIDADFPYWLTLSSLLYSDEGWYCNAAVFHFMYGHWYVPGDLNLAINMPFGHIAVGVMFCLFGMNVVVARTTVILFFLLLIFSVCMLVKKEFGRTAGILAALILSTNMYYFAYSRFVIMEIPMISLVVLSMLISTSFEYKHRHYSYFLACIVLFVGVLTKNTAVFAVPMIAYMNAARERTTGGRLLAGFGTLALCGGSILLYNTLAHYYFPYDFAYFKWLNFDMRVKYGYQFVNAQLALLDGSDLDSFLYPVALFATLFMMFAFKAFRRNVLVVASILWFACNLVSLSLVSGSPTRYFLPQLVPVVILFCATWRFVLDRATSAGVVAVACFVAAVPIFWNSARVVEYMIHPRYTYVALTRDVTEAVEREVGGDRSKALIMGNMAPQLTLMTGLRSISFIAPGETEERLRTFRPNFCVVLGETDEIVKTLKPLVHMEMIGEFDAFDNYYMNRRFRLYRIEVP